MMTRPEFGRDRLPPAVAEDAPAWPPLAERKPLRLVGERDPGVAQVEFGDGIWHRYRDVTHAGYVAECGAKSSRFGDTRSRTDGEPTCPDRRCAP